MLVAVALIALLPLLAVLQYRWIGQISQDARERMQANLHTATMQFGQDLSQELIRAALAFQMDSATLSSRDWEKYADRYQQWMHTAPYPNLVFGVSFVEAGEEDDLRLWRLNPSAGRLEPAGWPPAYAELRSRLEALPNANSREARPGARPLGSGFAPEIPALVLPVYRFPPVRDSPPPPTRGRRRPPLAGCTIVELSVEFLRNDFFPELARKYFADGGGLAYHVAIVSRSDANRVIYCSEPSLPQDLLSSPDATANIPGLRPQDFFRFSTERGPAGGTAPPPRMGPPRSAPPSGSPGATPPPRTGPPPRGQRYGGLAGRSRGFAPPWNAAGSDGGRWQLLVKHRSGSLENAVAGVRRRNLAVSFGVLLLLGSSVAMIAVFTRRAEKLAKLQMEFVAGVSHELRTPLAVICSAAENLADGVVDSRPQIQKYGSLIHTEGRRLSEMIDQILGFAMPQADRKKFELRPVDVAGAVEGALETSSRALREAGVEVARRIEPGLPPAMADPTSLANCIQNLVSNALKYGRDGGWLGVQARSGQGANGPEVQIRVEDKGLGIEPDDLPHIFEPFYRGGRALAAQIHGTGLGLSLVKRVMEAQGGRVTVESVPGQGCAFTLHLPAASESQLSAVSFQPSAPPTPEG